MNMNDWQYIVQNINNIHARLEALEATKEAPKAAAPEAQAPPEPEALHDVPLPPPCRNCQHIREDHQPLKEKKCFNEGCKCKGWK